MRFDDWTVHYAYTRVYSPEATETQFNLSCQQGCRLWLNGTEIFYTNVLGANENTAVPVSLHAGWNPVLIKVDRTKMQGSYLALEVRSKSGEALPDLKFDYAGGAENAKPAR
jgi:hypothetical protein